MNPLHFDLLIVGTGAGGGTLAWALRNSGMRILLVERGDFLPQEPENWQPAEVFGQRRYKPDETWYDATTGEGFHPGVHYFVGGNTKVYGAALPRFRVQDFQAVEHEGGVSPAWPITYGELEPYYAAAEALYLVHGQQGEDPTEPPRSGPYPFPPLPHEPYIEELHARLTRQGLHPFHYPMGVDLKQGGRCIRCKTCDGFPCRELAKGESDVCAVRPAVAEGVTLWTKSLCRRLVTDDTGKRVTGAEIERNGERLVVHADRFVVSCGAVNSALLLLRSANERHPNGLANSSGLVGRHYMVHNNTALMAVDPWRTNPTVFQKTIAINDFYHNGPGFPYPLGNIQALGKLQAGMLTAAKPGVPQPLLRAMAERSVDWWVMSEDLPDPENRVFLDGSDRVTVRWRPNNLTAHRRLVAAARAAMRAAGYRFVFAEAMGIDTNSHQCGTARFGVDPAASVLDPTCRTHDVENLYVVDSSFFPSSTAMNPALTIAAMALRVGEGMRRG